MNSLRGSKCDVASHMKPLQCTLRGIKEAVNFHVVARACFAGQNKCEPPIDVSARTKLRGRLFKYSQTFYCRIFCNPVDAADLKFDVTSPTSMKATVIPPQASTANYFVVYFRHPEYSGYCSVYFGHTPNWCPYKNLKPGHTYEFVYLLGATPGGLDISSGKRYKSFTMPPKSKESDL